MVASASASSPPAQPFGRAGARAGLLRQLHDADPAIGADHLEGAVRAHELDVGCRGLELLRGELPAALDHLVRGVADRHPGGGQRARAAGAAALGQAVGIALHDPDLLERHAEPLVQDLGVGGLVALAVRLGADRDADAAVVLEADRGELELIAHRRFDVVAHADAAPEAAPRRLRPALPDAPPVGDRHRLVHDPGELARIIGLAGRRAERHRARVDQVAAPELGRVDADLARRGVHQTLHQIDRFRPAGAAIGVDGRGVGQHALDPVDQVLEVIDAGQDLDRRPGRDERAEHRGVGAEVGAGLDRHAEDPVIGIERELGRRHVVAAHHVGDEGLAALAGPFHRPPELLGREGEHGVFRVGKGLGAEAAADVGGHHPEIPGLGPQNGAGDHVAHPPDVLRAGVQGILAPVELGERGARLHRVRDQAVVDDPQLDHAAPPGRARPRPRRARRIPSRRRDCGGRRRGPKAGRRRSRWRCPSPLAGSRSRPRSARPRPWPRRASPRPRRRPDRRRGGPARCRGSGAPYARPASHRGSPSGSCRAGRCRRRPPRGRRRRSPRARPAPPWPRRRRSR